MTAPDPMLPTPVKVVGVRREAPGVVTLTLQPGKERRASAVRSPLPLGEEKGEGRPLRAFAPGQFNMTYVFGVGEVPLSCTGDPGRSEVVEHTVKAVGAVSSALCQLKKGAWLGLRGPFGRPWPMAQTRGEDLVLIAGGIGLAPLMPVVHQVLAQRSDYGRVQLLVGARSPKGLLYPLQLERWAREGKIDVRVTVDHAGTEWTGRVGVVPALIDELNLETSRTAVFVCGPEIMMRFCVRALLRQGVRPARVFLSLERNMKCAVGFCGHCQYGPSFVCKDGPVLSYERIEPLFWRREV